MAPAWMGRPDAATLALLTNQRNLEGNMAAIQPSLQAEWAQWKEQGAVAGVAAGVTLAFFEILTSVLDQGLSAAFLPIRLAGALALGPEVLDPGFPLPFALVSGIAVYGSLCVLCGITLGFFSWRGGPSARTVGRRAAYGALFGAASWLALAFLVGPAAGWPRMTDYADAAVQLVGYAVFFGIPLGFCVGSVHPTASPRAVQRHEHRERLGSPRLGH